MVARHDIPNLDWALEDIEDFHSRLSKGIPIIVSSPAYLGNFGSEAMRMGFASIALNRTIGQSLSELRLAANFVQTHWTLAGKLVQQIAIDVEGHHYEIISNEINNFVSFSNWLFAAMLAKILRDKTALKQIVEGGESFFGKIHSPLSGAEAKEARFFTSTFGKNPLDSLEPLESWLEDASRDGKEYREMIKLPQGQLWRSIIKTDTELIEGNLRKALELHKAFWGTKEMRQDKNG
jgi:hypothetical protein